MTGPLPKGSSQDHGNSTFSFSSLLLCWSLVWFQQKTQTEPQASLLGTWPQLTSLTLWIASRPSTLALCSEELVSSAHLLARSLLFALLKGEISAVQGLVMLN